MGCFCVPRKGCKTPQRGYDYLHPCDFFTFLVLSGSRGGVGGVAGGRVLGMTRIETDRELLDGIRRDAPGAFEEFVRRYGGRIYGFGMRVCGEVEDAKDVAQDTLFQAFRALKDVKEPEALRSWLYRVVSNACLMRRRKGKYEPKQELTLEELMPRGREDAEIQIPDMADLPVDADSLHPMGVETAHFHRRLTGLTTLIPLTNESYVP